MGTYLDFNTFACIITPRRVGRTVMQKIANLRPRKRSVGSTPTPSAVKKISNFVKSYSRLKGYNQEPLEQKFLMLTEELGEFAKAVRKSIGIKIGSHSQDSRAGEEAADVLYLLVDICNNLNLDLEKEFFKKMEIVKQR